MINGCLGGDTDDENVSWVSWFCSLNGNEFFCEVGEDFIKDDFNLTGLSAFVSHYDEALDVLQDVEPGPLASYLFVFGHQILTFLN